MIGALVAVSLMVTSPTSRLSKEADYAKAAALWLEFGMPIAPPDAVPVILKPTYTVGGKLDYPGVIAFLKSKSDLRSTFILGSDVFEPGLQHYRTEYLGWNARINFELDSQLTKEEFQEQPIFRQKFNEYNLIATAVQSYIAGHREFCDEIMRYRAKSNAPEDAFSYNFVGCNEDLSLKHQVAMFIAADCLNSFVEPDGNRKEGLRKLKLLVQKEGVMPENYWTDRRFPEWIQVLENTVAPSGARKGSAQAAVDDLINVDPGLDGPEYQKVLSFGQEAVGPLTEELKKRRITRGFCAPLFTGGPTFISVATVARMLLDDIAKGKTPKK